MAWGDPKGTLVGGGTSTTATTTATGSVSVAVGDLIICHTTQLAAAIVMTTMADNLGHSYTGFNVGFNTSVAGRAYWKIATAAGTLTTITQTWSATSANDWSQAAVVFPGPFAASPLDANPAWVNGNGNPDWICPLTGTLVQPVELVVCFLSIGANGQTDVTATAPLLLAITKASAADNAASSVSGHVGYKVVSAITSTQDHFNFTAGSTASSVVGVASFKKAPLAMMMAHRPLRIWKRRV